jgi:hypothetical protein
MIVPLGEAAITDLPYRSLDPPTDGWATKA